MGCQWDELIDKKAEYLIIDLAEERIPKMKIELSSNKRIYIPNHFFYQNLIYNLKEQYQCSEYRFCNHPWEELKKNYETFCETINAVYKNKIIIIEVYMCNDFLDKDYRIVEYSEENSGFSKTYIKAVNDYLKKIYTLLENLLPQAKIVRLPSNNFGTYYHRWGINPLHYTEETYVYLKDCVENYMKEKSIRGNQDKYEQLRLNLFVKREVLQRK